MAWGAVAGAAIGVIGGAMVGDGGGGSGSQSNAQAERLSGVQADIAEDQFAFWEQWFKPLEEQFANESKGMGSIANQNKSAQQAAADVAGQFAGARERLVGQPGVNPNSQAALREQNRINLAEAAASAAAQSTARQVTKDRGRAGLADAVNVGKGIPANAMQGMGSAATGLRSAADYWQRQQAGDTQAAGQFGHTIGGIVNSKGFQNWMNGTSPTTPPNPYAGTPIIGAPVDLPQNAALA